MMTNVRRFPSGVQKGNVDLYEYTVRGVTHQGTEIAIRPLSSLNPEKVEKVIARYPAGVIVRVFHDPSHPETSVLERTSYSNAILYMWIAIGSLLTLVGVAAHPRLGGAEGNILAIVGRLFLGAGILMLLGFGIFLILWALREGRKWHACRRWPSVEGTVIRSSILSGIFAPHTAYRIPTGIRMKVAEPRVAFEYRVGGVTY